MINFIRPTLPSPEEWLPFLAASYRERYFSNRGPCVRQLEAAMAEKFASPDREVILVSSCTAGISAALISLGIQGPVILPAFTFPATVQATLAANCTPVFSDVSPATWELDPRCLENLLLAGSAKAIIHVRTFGFCHDLSEIDAIATSHGVPLIVDAAAALGGTLSKGQHVGSQGLLEVFSLHATKVFGIGEGGVIFAPRGRIADGIRSTINFGLQDGITIGPGLNGKLSEFAAAVGLAMLDKIDTFISHRTSIVDRYLLQLGAAICSPLPEGISRPPWQTFPVLLNAEKTGLGTTRLVKTCKARGLEVRRYYHPAMHQKGFFSSSVPLPCTEMLAEQMICLPVYSDMTASESDEVIRIFREALSTQTESCA